VSVSRKLVRIKRNARCPIGARVVLCLPLLVGASAGCDQADHNENVRGIPLRLQELSSSEEDVAAARNHTADLATKRGMPIAANRNFWLASTSLLTSPDCERPMVLTAGLHLWNGAPDDPVLSFAAVQAAMKIDSVRICARSPNGQVLEISFPLLDPADEDARCPGPFYHQVYALSFVPFEEAAQGLQAKDYGRLRMVVREREVTRVDPLRIPEPIAWELAVAVVDSEGRSSTYMPVHIPPEMLRQ